MDSGAAAACVMTERASRQPPGAWLPYAGLAITLGGFIWQASAVNSRVEHLAERIVVLEANDKDRAGRLAAIDVRSAVMDERGKRIEGKLDAALPDRGRP